MLSIAIEVAWITSISLGCMKMLKMFSQCSFQHVNRFIFWRSVAFVRRNVSNSSSSMMCPGIKLRTSSKKGILLKKQGNSSSAWRFSEPSLLSHLRKISTSLMLPFPKHRSRICACSKMSGHIGALSLSGLRANYLKQTQVVIFLLLSLNLKKA